MEKNDAEGGGKVGLPEREGCNQFIIIGKFLDSMLIFQ